MYTSSSDDNGGYYKNYIDKTEAKVKAEAEAETEPAIDKPSGDC